MQEWAPPPPDRARMLHQLSPLRGGYDPNPVTVVGSCTVVFSLLMLSFVASLPPNEYGLTRNYITGAIESDVQRGGIHLLGPLKDFIKFPATQITLEFSHTGADRPPIQARTGADWGDTSSGGQPISISCAVQFVFEPSTLSSVYYSLGSYAAARQRFLLICGNEVSNIAQEFTPQEFWKRREHIAARMLSQINSTLWDECQVVVQRFQLIKVEFAQSFENSITEIQVAEQQSVVSKYNQEVQQVVQSIAVLGADNDAAIAGITAKASADAKEICAHATRDAFTLKQGRKASKYAQLQGDLRLGHDQMQEYLLIKAVQGQSAQSGVVVGLPGFEDLPDPVP